MSTNIDVRALQGQPVIVGAGIAGLLAALHLGNMPCVLVSCAYPSAAGTLTRSVRAALGEGETAARRASRTLACGAGLAAPESVEQITAGMETAIAELEGFGISLAAGTPQDTGYGLHAALLAAVHARPHVTIISPAALRRLILVDGQVCGVVLDLGHRKRIILNTDAVILATGGTCGLYADGVAPSTATGAGLAVAARAGAVLSDLEFVHFHAPVLALEDASGHPVMVPLSACGAGMVLGDERGRKMDVDARKPSVLARAVAARAQQGLTVYLDLRPVVASWGTHPAPEIATFLQRARDCHVDPVHQALPVRTAAAFHIGGIQAGVNGKTSVPGLWACGEAACTGFHGAAVLEGNPLLEAVVCSALVAASVRNRATVPFRDVSDISMESGVSAGGLALVRALFHKAMGPMRSQGPLVESLQRLSSLAAYDDIALVAQMMLIAALRRQESRGDHFRSDFPSPAGTARHLTFTEHDVQAAFHVLERNTFAFPSLDTLPDAGGHDG